MSSVSPLTVQVSVDRMVALLTIDAAAAPAGVPVGRVMEALSSAGVRASAEFLERLRALERSGENLSSAAPIIVARGFSPTDARAPQLQPVAPSDPGDVPEHQRCKLPVTQPGQKLAMIIQGQVGADGCDVLGTVLPFRKAGAGYELKRGVRVSDDGIWIEAAVAGLHRVSPTSAEVEAGLSLPGNVDLSTGSINFDGDVSIGGNILDRFEVAAAGSIFVGGSIEAAVVRAGKDLVVERGVVCKDRGRCEARGNIRARHATNADISAGGDLEIHGEAANCRLSCRGVLRSPNGAVSGGVASAFGGAFIGTIGSPAGVKTVIEAGFDGELLEAHRRSQAELERMTAQAAALRAKAATLLQHQRNLTAQQKETATELLFQAQELEEAVSERRKCAGPQAENFSAVIEFQRCIHAGVIVRWGDVETLITSDLPGPGIIKRVDGAEVSIVVVGRSGREFRLRSRAAGVAPRPSIPGIAA